MSADKPLGQKAYGHIAHLPGSRMGPGDHKCHEGQARIATEKARDRHDMIWVQEKLDGSCVSVARVGGELIPLSRAGYRAVTSPYLQHTLWAEWVLDNIERFDALLFEGERVVGEWMAQAHGTRYDLTNREPFVAFDLMRGGERLPFEAFMDRIGQSSAFATPPFIGVGPLSIEEATGDLGCGSYGALEPVEGAVWRVERKGKVDFLAKYVRPDKVDGCYLDSVTGKDPVWNWSPA